MKIRSEWFMGRCEACDESHSVKWFGTSFQCWKCMAPSAWKARHALWRDR